MKSMLREQNGSRGFTIIELLTVMSVIILLMGLFMPAMNMVRRYARKVAQHNQFHAIEVALAMFNAEWQEYPNSATDGTTPAYSGAEVLAESMVGRDLLGYAPDNDYLDEDLSDRRMYLETGNANANRLDDIYHEGDLSFILSDVYPNVDANTGSTGMPILYYVATVTNRYHSVAAADDPDLGSIYNYHHNEYITGLGMPWDPTGLETHLIDDDPQGTFYADTTDPQVVVPVAGENVSMPHRPTSYILLSAGFDGEYGTDDDVYNFSN